ncbi:MAG: adenylate/guanylate cyclase domain-containing protein [Chloroflexota bacterium]
MSSWILSRIIDLQNIAYLLVDRNFVVHYASSRVSYWVNAAAEAVQGRRLFEILPELVGVEALLVDLRQQRGKLYDIPRIQRPMEGEQVHYFDLYVEITPPPDDGYLVLMIDVTEAACQAQWVVTQRNELRLLLMRLQRANQQVSYLLKRFVPENVAEKLIQEQQLPQPGAEGLAQATMLFADMRNFTGLAEKLPLAQSLDLLNRCLSVVAEAVMQHGGSVIQLVGDQVMASFNAPQALEDHAWEAARAACQAQQGLKELFALEEFRPVAAEGFGIGLNTGEVALGYLEAGNHFQYAIFGDTTNVAAHLCALAAGGQVLVSQAVADTLQGRAHFVPLGEVQIKRRVEPVLAYEMLACD